MVASLFGASNGEQKAGFLNQLLGAVGPSVLSSGLLGGLSQFLGAAKTITPHQAEQVRPEAVQELAKQAQKQDPSIIERASSFYECLDRPKAFASGLSRFQYFRAEDRDPNYQAQAN